MAVTCPKNSSHTTFITSAHVVEEWKVDAEGNYIENLGTLEVSHYPDKGNIWNCAECGAEAITT